MQFCWIECWYASQRSTLLTHIGTHRPGLVLDPINRVASTHREMAFQPGSQKENRQHNLLGCWCEIEATLADDSADQQKEAEEGDTERGTGKRWNQPVDPRQCCCGAGR